MDVKRFKQLSIPKIEAGKMTVVVRDVIKGVQTSKQDVYEEPIREDIQNEIEEVSERRKNIANQIIPYSEQVERLALPGPSGEAPKLIIDANNDFTVYDFSIMQKLPLPSGAFLEYLTNPESVKKTYEVGEINSKLGQKKGSLKKTKNNRKKNKDKITDYQKKLIP